MPNLEETIGYQFNDNKLLEQALSHSSYANESKETRSSNERLEFLGDSVLSLVVSQYIFEHFRKLPEGELTKMRASLVCEKALHKFAVQINLGAHMLLGKGEENTGGRERVSILADAFEALIAAIFIDGGMNAARDFIHEVVLSKENLNKVQDSRDYKTILQEIVQKNPEERVEYKLISQTGPDHNKLFSVGVFLNSNIIGSGKGRSKKQAEQMAAKEAIALMGYET
ncbi:MAG: ribonuclease III [Clostridiales bacterium]|nr:ribonuclease III [Clostridiales bacterium]